MHWSEAAPAKLNLALHVRRRRADGYHDLETLFAFTDFGDRLEMQPAEDWGLTISGPMAGGLAAAPDNLVLAAARAFAARTGCRQRFAFRLVKHIPVAAGLGGGSADAAAALRLLARATGAGGDVLEEIAAGIGADVAACIRSETCIGSGRGERLRPGGPPLTGMPVLLVNPGVALATGPVFAGWDGHDRGPLGDWRSGRNDLEAPAIRLCPAISDVLGWLRQQDGATMVRMSGSGATCFALFSGAVPPVQPPGGWWWRTSVLR